MLLLLTILISLCTVVCLGSIVWKVGQVVSMQTMIVFTSQSIALARTEPVISTNILESELLHSVRLICFYLLLAGHICFLKIGISITGFSSSFSHGTIRYISDRWHCFLHSALWVEENENDSGGAACLHHGKFFTNHTLDLNNSIEVVYVLCICRLY